MSRRSSPTPSAPWAWPLLWLGLAALYLFSGRLCIAVSALVANVSWVLFIPAGLSLTASLLWGARVAPGVFLGELAIGLTSGQPLGAAFLMAAGNGLDAALAGWWFRDRLGRRIEFDRLDDVVQLLVAELLVLQPLSTGMGMLALTSAGHMPRAELWASASAWYAANVFAQFVAAPTALVWIRWKQPLADGKRVAELMLLTALAVLVGAFGPGRWAPTGLPLPVALVLAFPLLVWASVRFVPSVAVTLGAVLGLFAFDAVLSGGGPLRGEPPGDQMLYLNIFMGVCLATALFLAAAMGQARRFEEEQARLIAELRSAAAQVKRMEEFVTFCAWTGRVRWNNQWVSVEEFLRERYNVSVSHGISEEGLATILKDLPREAAAQRPGARPPSPPPQDGDAAGAEPERDRAT
jgi:integral membrane sensor domain MASE1